jgi:multidrug efflux pump subunit AcrA (membrane-fusion protein)
LKRAISIEGDEVKRGDAILVIDPSLLESALLQAESKLRREGALSTSAEAHQNEVLFKEGIVPAELAERTRAAADASQATVAVEKVAVERAPLQFSFCRITSPIHGRVDKHQRQVGRTATPENNE